VNGLGGFIRPGEKWQLGHADGESIGGPEHVACNAGAPSRLLAEKKKQENQEFPPVTRTSRKW
jgi:hypothetical protein